MKLLKHRDLCQICGEYIFDKYKGSKYCKECAEEIRARKLSLRPDIRVKKTKSLAKSSACERIGFVGRPRLKRDIIFFMLEEDKKGVKPKDIIKYVELKFGVKVHRNNLANYRKRLGGQNFTQNSDGVLVSKETPLIIANSNKIKDFTSDSTSRTFAKAKES